jgi:hypothetical protein
MTVTGPSLTSSTSIRAPNTPRATGTPSASRAESLVQRLGPLRGSGVREARPASFPGVGDQRELTDDDRLAADVEERAVEPALLVLEDPQARHLAGHPRGIFLSVLVGHAEEDAQAGAYLGNPLTGNDHVCARNALDDGPQAASSASSARR